MKNKPIHVWMDYSLTMSGWAVASDFKLKAMASIRINIYNNLYDLIMHNVRMENVPLFLGYNL